ncbi:MAG: hypothetical protein R3Y35_07275 [Clostridia bacterium]
MLENKIKNSLDEIHLEEFKKEDLYNSIIEKSQNEQYVSKFKMKNIKKFADRYVSYAAVAVILVGVFSVYSVQSDLFGFSDSYTVAADEDEQLAVASLETEMYSIVIPDGDGYTKIDIEDNSYDFLQFWEALKEVYNIDSEIFVAQEKWGKLELYFDESLQSVIDEQGLNTAVAIAYNYFYYFKGYDDINIYSDGVKLTWEGDKIDFYEYIAINMIEIN